jgi:hypothetical protein
VKAALDTSAQHRYVSTTMAVNSVLIALQASASGRRGTRPEDFILPLAITPADGVASTRAVEGGSSIVEFPPVRLRDFHRADEPSEAMFQRLDEVFLLAAQFLDRRPPQMFAAFRAAGIDVHLFVDVWMDQDQMEARVPADPRRSLRAAEYRHLRHLQRHLRRRSSVRPFLDSVNPPQPVRETAPARATV